MGIEDVFYFIHPSDLDALRAKEGQQAGRSY